jgi:hypothetical protein
MAYGVVAQFETVEVLIGFSRQSLDRMHDGEIRVKNDQATLSLLFKEMRLPTKTGSRRNLKSIIHGHLPNRMRSECPTIAKKKKPVQDQPTAETPDKVERG